MQSDDTRQEQRLLLYSIVITVVDAAIGIAVGLFINSSAIVFDGVYSVADAAMTGLALGVSVLLAKGSTRHFQFGFWHLEPMLVLLNSIILSLSCSYAVLVALNDLLGGGRTVSFGPGAVYAIAAGIVALAAGAVIGRRARQLGSELLGIDARNWIVSGVVSVALGISFLLAGAVRGTRFDHLAPYLDPAVLATLSLILLPLPLRACWRAAKDIIQVAPGDLDEEVRRLAREIQARHGFADFTTYVAKMGRARFVDVTFLAGEDFGSRPLDFFDGVRAEIAEGLGARPPSHWLNIEFTRDRQWL